MKKSIIICLTAFAVIAGFTSCKKGEACRFNNYTQDLIVNAGQWEFDNGANMYFCHFDVEELTAEVYNYGEVSVSREYNTGTKNAYQVALPETSYKQILLDNPEGSADPYYYQQHIDYAFGVGFVEVFVTISDFYYDDYQPENMLFRLQLTW